MLADIPFWLLFAIGACFGAIIGSFLGAAAYRIPNKISLTKTSDRSECPNCNHPLRASDNIPLLSWLFLRGKCRYCKRRISMHYFLFELLTACSIGFLMAYSPIIAVIVLVLAIIIPSVISLITVKD